MSSDSGSGRPEKLEKEESDCHCSCGCSKAFIQHDEAGRPIGFGGVWYVSAGGLRVCAECHERHEGSTVN